MSIYPNKVIKREKVAVNTGNESIISIVGNQYNRKGTCPWMHGEMRFHMGERRERDIKLSRRLEYI